ncbi:MAG: L,D-transpeptidase family protein [Lachnospiraceae bacterium]|nr:L,D-transpeptidase family protein [Lachnospiraceae bacterium]
MHKLTRISAAVLLSLSMASAGMMTAYADETVDYSQVGPGFSNNAPASGETSGTVIIRTEDGANGPTAADPAASGSLAPSAPVENVPTDQTQAAGPDQSQITTPDQPQTTVSDQPLTFTSDGEAAMRAYNRTQEFGESIVYIGASALRYDGTWTPSFIGDDTIHNLGNGWYSIQMILRNTLGNILYRTYSSTVGWSDWVMNGAETTHLTDGSAVEAMQVRIDGVVSNDYDIYYQSTLSDGTVLDWAKNGQTSGSMAEGKWLIGFRMTLVPKNTTFPYATAHAVSAPAGTDGIQFTGTVPTYKDGSGQPFTGWAWVNNQRYYIVNDQAVTGWQYIDGYKYFFDDYGMLVSDLRNILGDAGPYKLRINRVTDTLTVYAQDGNNGYILPVVSFLTTTGDDTPYGTFKIPVKYRWRLMYGDVYTQYAMRLKDGYMIHSVIFNKQDPYTLDASTYNNLGIGRSHGCTRLKTGEMKWIYDNCPVGTVVEIYDSNVPGPFEAPVLDATIPETQNYDPTDPTIPEAVAAMQAAAQNTASQGTSQQAMMVPMPSDPIN